MAYPFITDPVVTSLSNIDNNTSVTATRLLDVRADLELIYAALQVTNVFIDHVVSNGSGDAQVRTTEI